MHEVHEQFFVLYSKVEKQANHWGILTFSLFLVPNCPIMQLHAAEWRLSSGFCQFISNKPPGRYVNILEKSIWLKSKSEIIMGSSEIF